MRPFDPIAQERDVLGQPLDADGEDLPPNESVIPIVYDVASIRWVEYKDQLVDTSSPQTLLEAMLRDP
jgi:hypothetical protein